MLSRRQTELVLLMLNRADYIIGHEIADILNVTGRTVRSDIREINDYFKEYGIEIKADVKKGYYFSEEDIQKLHSDLIFDLLAENMDFDYPENSNERVIWILFGLLFGNTYSNEELEDLLYVSTTVLRKDLLALNYLLDSKTGIRLNREKDRYYIKAEESQIRDLISGIYTQRSNPVLQTKYSYFISGDSSFRDMVKVLCPLIPEFAEIIHQKLSGEGIRSFAADIALSWHRCDQGFRMDEQAENDDDTAAFLKDFLEQKLPEFQKLDRNDYLWLSRRLAGKDGFEAADDEYAALSSTIVRKAESLLERIGYQLKDRAVMIRTVSAILRRKKYREYYVLDNRRTVFSYAPVPFYFSSVFRYCIESMAQVRLNSTDTASLTLALQLSLVYPRIRTVIVTNDNSNTADVICKKIERHFGRSLDIAGIQSAYEFSHAPIKSSLVISTVPLESYGRNEILIDRLCSDDSIEKIRGSLRKFRRQNFAVRDEGTLSGTLESAMHILLEKLYAEKEIGCPDIGYVNEHLMEYLMIRTGENCLYLCVPLISAGHSKQFDFVLETPFVFHDAQYTKASFFVFSRNDYEHIYQFAGNDFLTDGK